MDGLMLAVFVGLVVVVFGVGGYWIGYFNGRAAECLSRADALSGEFDG